MPNEEPEVTKSLELSKTYLHFNSLIWQVPSLGLAIAAGIIVAMNEIGKVSSIWPIPASQVRGWVLFFGFLLLGSLTIALYRYRAYQAAAAPVDPPAPPFRQFPPANRFLQGSLCLTAGILLGLAGVQWLSKACPIYIGLAVGFVFWVAFEIGHKSVVEQIKETRKCDATPDLSQTPPDDSRD